MGTLELKSSIHKIIDGIQSEQLLQTLYDFLKNKERSNSDRMWDKFTDKQKQEILQAFEESDSENNLVDKAGLFRKTK